MRTDLVYQMNLNDAAARGWIEIAGYGPVYSHLYFLALRGVMLLLSSGRKSADLRKTITEKFGCESVTIYRQRYAPFEWFDVLTRKRLMAMAGAMLGDWPHRFIECCRASGLSRDKLFNAKLFGWGKSKDIPYWYWDAVRWHLTAKKYVASEDEVEAAFKYLYGWYDQHGRVRSERVRAAAGFLNGITWRRKRKLWKKFRIANRRLKVNRSSGREGARETADRSIMISDALWNRVKHLIPKGRPTTQRVSDRAALSGILHVLTRNCTWGNIPSDLGPGQRIRGRYREWRRKGLLDEIVALCVHAKK